MKHEIGQGIVAYEYFRRPLSPVVRAAVTTIASNATDAADLRALLSMMGVDLRDIRR